MNAFYRVGNQITDQIGGHLATPQSYIKKSSCYRMVNRGRLYNEIMHEKNL